MADPNTPQETPQGALPETEDFHVPRIRTMRDDLARIRGEKLPELPLTESGEVDLLRAIPESPGEPAPSDELPPLITEGPPESSPAPAWEPPVPHPSPVPPPQPDARPPAEEPPDIYERLSAPPSVPPAAPKIPEPSDLDLLGHLDGGMAGEKEIPGTETVSSPAEQSEPAQPPPPVIAPPPSFGGGPSTLPPPPLTPTRTETAPQEAPTPLKPEELLAIEEEVAPAGISSGKKFRIPKTAAVAAAAILLIGGALAAYLLFFRERPQPSSPVTETPSPSPAAEETPLPEMLFPVAATNTLTVGSPEETAVALQEMFAGTSPTVLSRVLVASKPDGGPQRFLTLDEILQSLNIAFPEDVRATLNTSRFMLFTRGEGETGATRLGIAIAVNDAAALRTAMAAWETSLSDDLWPLLDALGVPQPSFSPSFQTTVRRGLENRYRNFPEPTLSIDYTVDSQRNLFLIATSRATMYAAIDALP